MSDEFLRAFFPHAQQALERYAPHFLELAFPQWVRSSCPEPQHLLQLPGGCSVVLRHVSLLPLQLAGVATGVAALRRTGGFWRWGFAAFGLMNAVSVFAHDFGAASGAWWRAWATLDVVFTCTANVCVMLAARAQTDPRAYDGRGAAGTALALAVAAAAAAAGFGLPGVPFIHELLYIGTSVAAFFCCSWLLVRRSALLSLVSQEQGVAYQEAETLIDTLLCNAATLLAMPGLISSGGVKSFVSGAQRTMSISCTLAALAPSGAWPLLSQRAAVPE